MWDQWAIEEKVKFEFASYHANLNGEDVPKLDTQQINMEGQISRSSPKSPLKLSRSGEQETINKNSGHWTFEEKQKYFEFLIAYRQNFEKKELRRLDKIFKIMSTYLGTRAAEQCRSHHQKMEKKYKTFQKILASREQIQDCPSSPQKNQERFHRFSDADQLIDKPLIKKDYFLELSEESTLFTTNHKPILQHEYPNLLPIEQFLTHKNCNSFQMFNLDN